MLFIKTTMLVLALLACLGSCTSIWDQWNIDIINNSGNPLSSYSYPSPPLVLGAYQIYRNAASITPNRRYQYSYYFNIPGLPTCNIYCGPRSYLVVDGSGAYVC